MSSVTRLGEFRKFLATNSLTKVAQKDCWLLGLFWKRSINVKTAEDIFRQLVETFGQPFYPNIWSYWQWERFGLFSLLGKWRKKIILRPNLILAIFCRSLFFIILRRRPDSAKMLCNKINHRRQWSENKETSWCCDYHNCNINNLTRSPGLELMGGDSCAEGRKLNLI